MIKFLIAALIGLSATTAYAASGRVIEAGTLKGTPTLTIENGGFSLGLPSLAGTILTNNSTATLTNKTIDGASNTLTNITANAFSGTLGIANGGTGLTSLGGANYFLGADAANTALEYKQFATGTSGSDFNIAHAIGLITFNLPTASGSNRGALSSADWTTFNSKVDGPGSSVDGEIALFDSTTGKLIKRATGSGFVKSTSGVYSTSASVNAATELSGITPVANGGTGASTLTANNVILGNGTSAVQFVAPGTNGNVLTSNGTTWTSAAPGGGSGITELTGDVTAGPGSGSQAATLATVNANVGSFTNANITVNAKGLITAAANGTGGSNTAQVHSFKFPTTANCSWSLTGSSYVAFSTDADCPGPTVIFETGTGTGQTTDADLPKVTVNSLPAGTYRVWINGPIAPQNDGETMSLAINDGTDTRQINSGSWDGGYNNSAGGEAFFKYASSGNRTFELYGQNSQGNGLTMSLTFGTRSLIMNIEKVGD
jgi:hypothetical protein